MNDGLRPVYADPDINITEALPEYDAPAEESCGWDIGFGFRITFAVDHELVEQGDDDPIDRVLRGLHVTVCVGPDFPNIKRGSGGLDVRAVTTEQLRQHASHLIALAEQVDRRRAGVPA